MQRGEEQSSVTIRRQVTYTIFIGWLGLIGLLGPIELWVPSLSHAEPGQFGAGRGLYDFSPGPPAHADRDEYARPRGRSRPGGPPTGRFVERHAERLGLDEDTQSSIAAITDTSHANGKNIHQSLRRAHQKMRELLQQDTPNEASVLRQAQKIGILQIEEQKNRLQAMLQIRALLTPEQRQTIIQFRKENRPRRQSRGRARRKQFNTCRENVARLCPNAESGHSSIQCLANNWDALSHECHTFFERRAERGSRRR